MSHNPEDCAKCDKQEDCPDRAEQQAKEEALRSLYTKFGIAGVCVVIAEAILRKSENDMFDILLRSCRMTGVSRKFDELKRITEEARVAAKEANREELLEAMLKVVHKEITIMILDTAAKVAKDIATTMGVGARLTIHHGDAEEMAELLAAKEEFVKVVPPSGTVH
jgi:hypothetical protein